MKTKTPKGIIFDCDGTLADTMPLHWRAWQAVANRHRLHFPEDRFYELGGVPTRVRGHGTGLAGDSRRGDGGGGCERAAREALKTFWFTLKRYYMTCC